MDKEYKHMSIPELPIDEQPRYKLSTFGSGVLSNAELFAIIIGTGNKHETAVQLSQRILKSCDNDLTYFVNASIDELSKNKELKGIGYAKACKIKAAFEIGRRLSKQSRISDKIRNPRDIANLLFDDMKYLNQEHFKIVLLDTKNQVTSVETITVGTLNASLVHPREVFRIAINKSSSAIIAAHNHPSGDPNPSNEDKRITNRLRDAGEIIGIKLLDHIVIGYDNYISFKEIGLL